MFDEPYRPQFHFTPPQGRINDPNGLVYFNGEWHLFYQLIDASLGGGGELMWGHAVSDDLLHWQHLPPAIVADGFGTIWSGSAVVDHHDTSGLFGGKAGIVCVFTYFDKTDGFQSQGLAYSADGRNFTTLDKPVLPKWKNVPGQKDDSDFRDPKIGWHAPTGRWFMAVAGGRLRIYSSANLIDWRFESIAEDINTECPDLMELPIDGDPKNTTWLLSGGGRWYLLGDFDGKRFAPTTARIPLDVGPDYYATQTWSDAPDGRRIAISWLFDWKYETGNPHPFPTSPWERGGLTIPVEWALRTTSAGVRLFAAPLRELDALRDRLTEQGHFTLHPGAQSRGVVAGKTLDIYLTFKTAAALTIALPAAKPEYTVTYDAAAQRLTLDRTAALVSGPVSFPLKYDVDLPPAADGTVRLRLLIDHYSVEIFAHDGALTMSALILPDPASGGVRIDAIGGACEIETLTIDAIRSTFGG